MTGAGQEGAEETVRRAEELLSRWTREARDATVRTLARAREEAEDMWAEAREASSRRSSTRS